MRPDISPAIIGCVVDENKKPIADALIALYKSTPDVAPEEPIGWLYSDEFGGFAFGSLEAGTLYIVRVYKNSGKMRTL